LAFALGGYKFLPTYNDEILLDSAVLVIFTVARYDYQGTIPVISFNVQHVILLVDANEDYSATKDENEEKFKALGVKPAEEVEAADCHEVEEAGPLV
jgi:hypothetical protein